MCLTFCPSCLPRIFNNANDDEAALAERKENNGQKNQNQARYCLEPFFFYSRSPNEYAHFLLEAWHKL